MQDARGKGPARLRCWLLGIALAALAAWLLVFIYTPHAASRIILAQLQEGATFTAQEIAQLRDGPAYEQVRLYARDEASFATTGNKAASGHVYHVPPAYFEAAKPAMLAGRTLWTQDAGCPYVMLSDTMAIALFGYVSVAGEAMLINGQQYTIIGVYAGTSGLPAKLAYYNENTAYVLQEQDDIRATHIEVILHSAGQSSLGIAWLRQSVVRSQLTAVFNLAQAWAGIKTLARGFVALYGLAAWLWLCKRGQAVYQKNRDAIQSAWRDDYAGRALRRSAGPLLRVATFLGSMGATLLGLLVFFGYGLNFPSAYIPAKLLPEPIMEAFLKYVYDVNTRVSIAHPLVAQAHWQRMLVLVAGGLGGVMIMCLRKQWRKRRC